MAWAWPSLEYPGWERPGLDMGLALARIGLGLACALPGRIWSGHARPALNLPGLACADLLCLGLAWPVLGWRCLIWPGPGLALALACAYDGLGLGWPGNGSIGLGLGWP
jgi:hypothetical protein